MGFIKLHLMETGNNIHLRLEVIKLFYVIDKNGKQVTRVEYEIGNRSTECDVIESCDKVLELIKEAQKEI